MSHCGQKLSISKKNEQNKKIKIKIEQNCCFLSIFKQNWGKNAQKIFQMSDLGH